MGLDLFGINAAKKTAELSIELVKQKEIEIQKIQENVALEIKAARTEFLNQFRNFNTQIFPHYNVAKEHLIYQKSADIYAVASDLATQAAMIPFYGEYRDGSELKDSDKLHEFIDKLTFAEKFKAYLYLLISGEIFGYKEKIEFGVNAGVQKIRFLDPASVVVYISDTFPTDIVGYRYYDTLHGITFDIAPEDMMFVKLFNPDPDVLQQVRGLSPVRVLKQVIQRSTSGYDISIAQLQNGGQEGVLVEKTIGIEPAAMGQRQDKYARFVSNPSNKGAPYMMNGDIEYVAIGSTLADMNLAELSAIDLDKICNVYHVSSTEYNNKKASTESNVEKHGKSYYTKGIIPIVTLFKDGLNSEVIVDIKTTGKLREDVSDIIELQPNMKEKAAAYAASPMMIPNDVLEGMGHKRSKDPEMDEPYIKTGYQSFKELNMPDPTLDNTAGDYNPAVPPVKIPASANGKKHNLIEYEISQ